MSSSISSATQSKLSAAAPALKMSVQADATMKITPPDSLTAVLPLEGSAGGEKIIVRIMTPNDYPAVRELVPHVSQCVMTHGRSEIGEILRIPTYHPFCAFDASNPSRLVAFAELHRMPHIGRSFDGRLERVVVLDSERGKGIASALCHFIVAKAKDVLNCNRVDLTAENERAKHIYTNKLGFKKVDTNVYRIKF